MSSSPTSCSSSYVALNGISRSPSDGGKAERLHHGMPSQPPPPERAALDLNKSHSKCRSFVMRSVSCCCQPFRREGRSQQHEQEVLGGEGESTLVLETAEAPWVQKIPEFDNCYEDYDSAENDTEVEEMGPGYESQSALAPSLQVRGSAKRRISYHL